MSNPEPEPAAKSDLSNIPPEYQNGVWVNLEGAEEDITVRRVNLPPKVRQHYLEGLALTRGTPLPNPGLTTAAEGPAGTPAPRAAHVQRETAETKIDLTLNLDGTGRSELSTGVGFFDHMLTLLARHSLIDLTVQARGDLHVDPHHTVEDVGLCLGKALAQALGDKAGIRRYGSATLPMDEVLVTAAVDLSGRPFCVWQADLPPEVLGSFNAPLAEEFWRAVSSTGAFTLHVLLHHGRNSHHIVEGVFKAAARALRQAVEPDPRMTGVPSTKGVL
jgi:imidazoleglycerol-phosphate dehydratase